MIGVLQIRVDHMEPAAAIRSVSLGNTSVYVLSPAGYVLTLLLPKSQPVASFAQSPHNHSSSDSGIPQWS